MTNDREVTFSVQTWKIDIGEDGGTLEITADDPPVYLINDHVVNEAAAYAWIRHWHDVRDNAPGGPGAGFCACEPCVTARKASG